MIEILNGLVEIEFWGFLCITCTIIAYLCYHSVFFLMVLAPAALGLKWFITTTTFLIKYKHSFVPLNSLVTRLLISIPIHIILIVILKHLINNNPKP